MQENPIIASTNASPNVGGKYLDPRALNILKDYCRDGELRVGTFTTITGKAAYICKESLARSPLYLDASRSHGKKYTTRQYAAYIRELNYILHSFTYAVLHRSDLTVLDEPINVLKETYLDEPINVLKETYSSTESSISAITQAIQAMKEVLIELVEPEAKEWVVSYLDYIIGALPNDMEASVEVVGQLQGSFLEPAEEPAQEEHRGVIAPTASSRNSMMQNIWRRGDRMIALSSGGAFLGGLIAQVPGAAVGAVIGAIFGWFNRTEATNHTASP